ncbi:MAG: thrombospondin type 3 repeat-containing protein [Patescibacteria group bacterium]
MLKKTHHKIILIIAIIAIIAGIVYVVNKSKSETCDVVLDRNNPTYDTQLSFPKETENAIITYDGIAKLAANAVALISTDGINFTQGLGEVELTGATTLYIRGANYPEVSAEFPMKVDLTNGTITLAVPCPPELCYAILEKTNTAGYTFVLKTPYQAANVKLIYDGGVTLTVNREVALISTDSIHYFPELGEYELTEATTLYVQNATYPDIRVKFPMIVDFKSEPRTITLSVPCEPTPPEICYEELNETKPMMLTANKIQLALDTVNYDLRARDGFIKLGDYPDEKFRETITRAELLANPAIQKAAFGPATAYAQTGILSKVLYASKVMEPLPSEITKYPMDVYTEKPQLVITVPCSTDEDNDGVPDEKDVCPGTVADTFTILKPDNYMFNGKTWVSNVGSNKKPEIIPALITMEDTRGCSCAQIIESKQTKETAEDNANIAAGLYGPLDLEDMNTKKSENTNILKYGCPGGPKAEAKSGIMDIWITMKAWAVK